MCVENQSTRDKIVWLAAGYFDESIDNEVEDRCFSIAGFYGSQEGSARLDLIWKDVLDHWKLSYFKASEIEFGFGEFAKYRDDPKNIQAPLSQREKDIIRDIKTDFVDIICKICSTGSIIGIGVTCVMRDLYLFRQQEPELAKKIAPVYSLCGDFMLMVSGSAMTATNVEDCPHNPGFMQPVFDQQEEYGPRFVASFPQFAYKNPRSSRFLKTPMFESELTYRCLQAADLLAFEARKLLINTLYDPTRKERKAMTRLKEHVDTLYLVNYETLRLIAENQKGDSIPMKPRVDNRRDKHFAKR